MENEQLRIAKLIGQPINEQLPVPVELAAIADTFTAEPGEHVWRYQNLDTNVDVVLTVDSDGKITTVKRTPLGDVELTFTHYNSKLDYVLVTEILDNPDTDALSRRKEAITRGMDKTELKSILDAILTPTNAVFPANSVGGTQITVASGEDLYDVLIRTKQTLEDKGTDYVLLCGANVKAKIDTYDKDQAGTLNYNVTLNKKLAELGIEVMKIFGTVSNVTGETESSLLDTSHFIMIAKNSRVAEGKPIKLVRRKISPKISAQMGVTVDAAQRGILVGQSPVVVDFSGTSSNVLGYSVYGYESVIFCITNPSAIAWCDASSLVD
jgi:hypothetical protein